VNYNNVFVVVTFEGDVLPYIAEDVMDAIQQHADKSGDSNVAGAFVYGNEFVKLSKESK
jgi:hypothetical protein